ncbi:ABC transporter substrate-binding protein [Microbacterium invictum]|uniref:Simple sugar transport system substrate-binding protein n=1 Tax=Microbacterium invictum TaxID=515415 RepID=A0AA40SS49_9MICO|nr:MULTISPECIES: ABC transporter substrate-binding protein [Microbacterium]MBB4141445.1 simple sugar transport system substrate-binding protein [Microbacterium invictum]
MKKLISIAAAGVLLLGLAGCATDSAAPGGDSDAGPKALDELVVGFAQVGAESGWRTANTKDIQSAFADAGIELKFSDAQQKQENQIKAIRSYIQQGVDYIAFSPVVETGWDAVLNEAKAAGIPVVLTDRAVDSQDESLYVSFLGSDFILEGEKAGQWLLDEYADTSEPVNIVQLEGTTGAAPAIDRAEGFAEKIAENDNFQVIASQTGDFTRAGGKQVMEAFLKSNPDIDVVYAHNDDMGLGAIEAIEAAGLTPGEDIKIITVDAVKDGMQALADGKINFIVECSPLLGDQLVDIIKTLNDGGTVEKRIVTEETTFTQEQAIEALPDRQY